MSKGKRKQYKKNIDDFRRPPTVYYSTKKDEDAPQSESKKDISEDNIINETDKTKQEEMIRPSSGTLFPSPSSSNKNEKEKNQSEKSKIYTHDNLSKASVKLEEKETEAIVPIASKTDNKNQLKGQNNQTIEKNSIPIMGAMSNDATINFDKQKSSTNIENEDGNINDKFTVSKQQSIMSSAQNNSKTALVSVLPRAITPVLNHEQDGGDYCRCIII